MYTTYMHFSLLLLSIEGYFKPEKACSPLLSLHPHLPYTIKSYFKSKIFSHPHKPPPSLFPPPPPPLPHHPQFNSVDLLSRSRNIVERIRWFLSTWFNYIHLYTRVSLGLLFMRRAVAVCVTASVTALLWKKTALLWRKLPYKWHKHEKAWTICIYWLFAIKKLNKINTMLREYSLLFLFCTGVSVNIQQKL